jgi:hypothetical protein
MMLQKSARLNHDHSRDRNGVDDGNGATGATDIRPHVDSNGTGLTPTSTFD